ncbi:hypothetical protein ABID92_000424 [Frigoribacterium sp. PvP120]|uniref:hypothetical protein n=1 Tax=unclassified Frigoribacterium TaxID=2627005 RepID=UPI001AEA04F2|nr:hypothetical protein [Frigoribacterium sp. PvP121]MBP1241748.1 hypothetical protein [Frigoribacterium sp. PvP121]
MQVIDGGNAASVFDSTLDGGNAASVFTNVELVPRLDRAPVERVEVTVTEILPDAVYVDIYRLAEGRSMLVRGGVRVYAVGGVTVVDFEAPFGVPITYRAEMFADQAGTASLGFTGSADTFLDVTSTCVHQPLNPELAVWPIRLQATAEDVTRSTPGELVYTEGASVGTWVGQTRRGIEGLTFDLMTATQEEANTFQAMLGGYGLSNVAVLCIRTPPPMRIPRVFFGTVPELHELDVDVANGGTAVRFQFVSDEAQPPAPGLVTAILSRDDIDAAYPTREARAAAYLTRLDRDRDYSLAGLAG